VPNLAVLALALSTPAAPADVRLAWKFKAGDVLRYRVMQVVQQSISGMGNMEMTIENGQVLKEKVQSVAPDGTAKLEVTWEALRFHLGAPMAGGMDYDSTKDAPESASGPMKGLAKLVGSSFQVEMKPSGEIVSLTGIDDLMKKVGSDSGAGPMGGMLQRSFSDTSMKRSLETVVFPEKTMADGETWKRSSTFDVPSLGKLKTDYDFKLDGTETVDGAKASKIGVLYSMSLGGGKPDMSGMPGAERFDVDLSMDDAKGDGTIDFSADLGRMVRTKLTSDMDINMNMTPKGDAQGGAGAMKLAVQTHQKLSTTLLGASDPAFEADTAGAKKDAKPEPKK
jgi:hypothetical protein